MHRGACGRLEHSHFAPWFGAMHYRSYANPYVHDLFVFHELAHAASLADDYDGAYTFQQWAQRLYDNELRVALESECLIYWEIPGLRRHTFDFEKWNKKPLPGGMPGIALDFLARHLK